MSVLIRNMDMPKTCEGCPLQHSEYLECKITGEPTWDWENAEAKYKSVNCPIDEIPPHGRLVDADALLTSDLGGEPFKSVIRRVLMQAPTVIEAERSN